MCLFGTKAIFPQIYFCDLFDSSIIPDTLIDLFLNLSSRYDRSVHNGYYQQYSSD
jgi:hypothetical protein